MIRCQVYVHIAILGNYKDFLKTIISRFASSGLYEYTEKIHLCFLGDISSVDLSGIHGDKYHILHVGDDVLKCEFPTIQQIWLDSQENDFDILYLHSKGVTRNNCQYISDWVDYLLYFNVDLWFNRVIDLKNCDVSGVNLNGDANNKTNNPETWGIENPPLHYSGNFWWSKTSHIRSLPEPMGTYLPCREYLKFRHMCEMWVCQNEDAIYYESHNSKVNHYCELYKRQNYININKPSIDVIFLTKTSNFHHYGLTQRSINSLFYNNSNVDLNVIVIETNTLSYLDGFYYHGCTVVHPDEDFNYNKFVKIGLRHCKNKFVIICNNDLLFTENSMVNMIASMERNNIKSSSPMEPNYHPRSCGDLDYLSGPIEGYVVTKHICGWCVAIDRSILHEYNDFFDERFVFWYQDCDYSLTLQSHGIKHFLLPNFKVRHEFCGSHDLLGSQVHEMTYGQLDIFKSKWPNH